MILRFQSCMGKIQMDKTSVAKSPILTVVFKEDLQINIL